MLQDSPETTKLTSGTTFAHFMKLAKRLESIFKRRETWHLLNMSEMLIKVSIKDTSSGQICLKFDAVL